MQRKVSQQDCPYAKQALDGGSGSGDGGVALCDSFSSLDHVAAVYTVASSFLSQSRPYVDDDLDGLAGRPAAGSRPTVECIFRGAVLMYRAWGMKDEEIYEEVNAKHRKAKLTLQSY